MKEEKEVENVLENLSDKRERGAAADEMRRRPLLIRFGPLFLARSAMLPPTKIGSTAWATLGSSVTVRRD